MEEKKEKQTEKTVQITEKQNPKKQNVSKEEIDLQMELDSMTKEKLKEVAGQLYYQNQQLMNRIKSMDMTNIFKRLDYLFKAVENADKFPEDFMKAVINEICSGIYPEETKE